jgi:hypothetical protein
MIATDSNTIQTEAQEPTGGIKMKGGTIDFQLLPFLLRENGIA